jgi:acetylornithine/succinyldiaminopimelate/putrescine aminotransferase
MHQTVYGEFVQSPQTQLAKKLVGLLPAHLDCVYFVNSGAEAIEGAMKLAKRHTGRHQIATFKNAYHGSTQGALSLLGDERMKQAFRPLIPGILQLSFNCFDDLELITDQCAAVFVEPIQTEAGFILPENGFLLALRQRCTETGALLVFDEIQVGFGRCGSLFAFEHFEVEPDILCIAKAFGGGMPLGAFVAPSQVLNKLSFDPVLGHITTFGGHPVSCAAALATLELYGNDQLFSSQTAKAQLFIEVLKANPLVGEIRHKGLFVSFDLPSEAHSLKLLEIMLEHKLISERFLFRPQAVRIAPPLVSTFEECQLMANLVYQSLNELIELP